MTEDERCRRHPPVVKDDNTCCCKKIEISGVVQGVGFRPFIFQLAHRYGFNGEVFNTSRGVTVIIEGPDASMVDFCRDIARQNPPLSSVTDIRHLDVFPPGNYHTFKIVESSSTDPDKTALIPPDVCVCDACLEEMHAPEDRRFEYPFINCTNCGPRYTIIKDVPYDRPKTSMGVFPMCSRCRNEYEDPLDRRFHAQPNACPVCGPYVTLVDKNGNMLCCGSTRVKENSGDTNPVQEAARRLKEGCIVAIKGLGGFHLAVDAMNHKAVERLRRGKNRPDKPFAVMAVSVPSVSGCVHINQGEKDILESFHRPIVLLRKRKDLGSSVSQAFGKSTNGHGDNSGLSPLIAPDNPWLGIMLPYTPLHALLLQKGPSILVMTSGNKSGEPLSIDNEDALASFAHIADFFLLHNRDIYFRADDSILHCHGPRPLFLRRSRGYAPLPVYLRKRHPQVLACGGGLKSTVCLTRENKAFLSQYVGDLDNERVFDFYQTTVSHLEKILSISPEIVAHDLHPGYMSTGYAMAKTSVEKVAVQHHHAHAVSCMAENLLEGEVIAVTLDGTGLGTDGRIWGGEILVCTESSFDRYAHVSYTPMPGGESAVKEPWRMAISYLYSTFGDELSAFDLPLFRVIGKDKVAFIIKMIKKGINCPLTSSCGRLFDGVASILGIRHCVSFESQAAMALQAVSSKLPEAGYGFDLHKRNGSELMTDPCGSIPEPLKIDVTPCIRGMVRDVAMNLPSSFIGAKFHRTVIEMFSGAVGQISRQTGVKRVVLSGGVFNNHLISNGMVDALKKNRMDVYTHTKVPAGDGGISLGQAVVAGAVVR